MYTLTINGNTPEELMANLRKLAQAGATPATPYPSEQIPPQQPTPPSANPTLPAAPTSNIYAATPTIPPTPPAAPVVPVAATAPSPPAQGATIPTSAPTANAAPPTTAPTYTLDALARAGATLAQSGKMEQALALLAKYGIQTVNQLKPEQYGAFATELRALGAQV